MNTRWRWLIVASGLFTPVADSAILAPGFSETSFSIPSAPDITDIEWAPDSSRRLFVARKNGEVLILHNGVPPAARFVLIDPPPRDYAECGLLGMCFDPNFVANGFVYLFITASDSEQKILRYEARGDIGTNKVELISNLPTSGAVHTGGGLAIGHDGRVYWGIGDIGLNAGVGNDLTSLASKVGRANLDGSVPQLNPFRDGAGPNHDLIWARGFRNPFKMGFQPATGLLWVNVAGSAYETIFLINRADHAGWNTYEIGQPPGYVTPKIKYRTNGTDTHALLGNSGARRQNNVVTFTTSAVHGFVKGEKISIVGVNDSTFDGSFYVQAIGGPFTFTVAQSGPDALSGGGTVSTFHFGAAVTGGCFYNSTAFPAEYHGNYFFCDFMSGRVNRAVLNASNEVVSVDYFVTGVTFAVDVTTGPDGALYYGGFNDGTLYRLEYTNASQALIVSRAFLSMAEGGVAVCQVSLANAPSAEVLISITLDSGGGIVVTNTALTFTPSNYAVPQSVYFFAEPDADPFSARAVFGFSGPSVSRQQVTVNAFDLQADGIQFTSVSRSNAVTRLALASEPHVPLVLETSANLRTWSPLTNTVSDGNPITFFDAGSPSNRFYRVVTTP
jgi:glucose/arabinose dehydrogenase